MLARHKHRSAAEMPIALLLTRGDKSCSWSKSSILTAAGSALPVQSLIL